MINLDYIAYIIIYLFVAFVVFPLMVSSKYSAYLDDVKHSFALQLILVILASITSALMWANNQIF